MSRKQLPAGTQLGGFEIISPLGQGNMGVVYLATQINLNRPVALKVIFEDETSDPDHLTAFFREAQAAAQFTHQHIVQAFDVGRTPAGVYYFAMELVNAGDLSEHIKRNGPTPGLEAFKLLLGVVDGLDFGNTTRGLTHGDLKPANILLTQHKTAKLADLGLARLGGDDSAGDGIMLTPLYAAPEIIRNKWSSGDPRADIYSMGATLYHLISGHTVFSDPDYTKILDMQLHAEPKPLREVMPDCPVAINDVVMHMLKKDPVERQQTWAEVKADMQRAIAEPGGSKKKKIHVGGHHAHAAQPATDHVLKPAPAGKKTPFVVAGVAVAVIAALAVGLSLQTGSALPFTQEQLEAMDPMKAKAALDPIADSDLPAWAQNYSQTILQPRLRWPNSLLEDGDILKAEEAIFRLTGDAAPDLAQIRKDAASNFALDLRTPLVLHLPCNNNLLNHAAFTDLSRPFITQGVYTKALYGSALKLGPVRPPAMPLLRPASSESGLAIVLHMTLPARDGLLLQNDGSQFQVSLDSGLLKIRCGAQVVTTIAKLPVNTPLSLCLSCSRNALKVWLDGSQLELKTEGPATSFAIKTLQFGSLEGTLIDELRLYDLPLTTSDALSFKDLQAAPRALEKNVAYLADVLLGRQATPPPSKHPVSAQAIDWNRVFSSRPRGAALNLQLDHLKAPFKGQIPDQYKSLFPDAAQLNSLAQAIKRASDFCHFDAILPATAEFRDHHFYDVIVQDGSLVLVMKRGTAYGGVLRKIPFQTALKLGAWRTMFTAMSQKGDLPTAPSFWLVYACVDKDILRKLTLNKPTPPEKALYDELLQKL